VLRLARLKEDMRAAGGDFERLGLRLGIATAVAAEDDQAVPVAVIGRAPFAGESRIRCAWLAPGERPVRILELPLYVHRRGHVVQTFGERGALRLAGYQAVVIVVVH